MKSLQHQSSPRTLIADLPEHIGGTVTVCGFVDTIRDQKRMQFIVLRDATGLVQIVHPKSDDTLTDLLASLTPESAISITGTVIDAPSVKLGGIEIALEHAELHSLAQSPLPIAEDSTLEKRMDFRQVSLRRPEQQLAFRVQTTLEHAMRQFWRQDGFTEIHSPKLMGTASESGAEVFTVKYFDTTAYLAQSPQFYKQLAMAGGMEKVFEIGPAFRAEPSYTTRHETEFTSVDMEVAWTQSHHDIMALEERFLVQALGAVIEQHGAEIERLFGRMPVLPTVPFPKITVEEAHRILRELGHPPLREDDMDSESERRIAEWSQQQHGHEFLFITDYPATARAFYHRRHEDKPHLTQGFDLLWRGLEITTGAQREHRHDWLVAQAQDRGYDLVPLQGYLDFFRYGCPPHGGMGIGIARIVMRLLDAASIREVTFVSRTPNRLTP